MTAKSLLREPFVQFLGLGFVVFIVMSLVAVGDAVDRSIHVSEADIGRLAGLWEAQYGQAPTEQELASIIDQFIREEILVREAMAIGLEDDDLIVRRRLAQKYEFLLDGRVAAEERGLQAGDGELETWYREQSARYRQPAQVSFRHAFFSEDRPGGNAQRDASQSLTQLQTDDVNWRNIGDPFMMQLEFAPRNEREITDLFGAQFAASVFTLSQGQWSAPVRSAYGWHAVLVMTKLPEAVPAFESMRDTVRTDYLEEQRAIKKQSAFAALKASYAITVGQANEVVH